MPLDSRQRALLDQVLNEAIRQLQHGFRPQTMHGAVFARMRDEDDKETNVLISFAWGDTAQQIDCLLIDHGFGPDAPESVHREAAPKLQ